MEKKIAIRGHKTRGRDVIRALEEMGGINNIGYDGSNSNRAYYIRHDFMISIENLYQPPFEESYSLYTIEEYEEYMKNKKETEHSDAKKLIEEEALKQYEVPTGSIKLWDLPEGYQFTDENGNVINATKIVLEKKKKEYPKSYEECCKVMDIDTGFLLTSYDINFWKGHLLTSLQKLLICRDAYLKIAGEEMGLGKLWEPNWENENQKKYGIYNDMNIIKTGICYFDNNILVFPTEEIRNAFYENFIKLVEQCKELL